MQVWYTPSHYRVYVSASKYHLKSRFIFRQILFNVVCKAFSRVQLKSQLDSRDFAWLGMEKRDSLSRQSCIFHAWTNTEKLNCLLRFLGKGMATTKHVDQIKDSDPKIILAI